MIFSELYSAYYNTVARIIETAFQPSVTEKDLQQQDAAKLLADFGYQAGCPAAQLRNLALRLSKAEGFPHEIGLFLSYPPEDVRGFMEKGGRDCKCVGTWKVYGDEEAAKRTFSRYKRCTDAYCSLHSAGRRSLEQLTVKS